MGFEIVEHTADLAVRLRAPDLRGLIESGVQALRALIFEGTPPHDAAELSAEADVRGVDREDVLVQALSEALHLMQSRRLFPREAQVEIPAPGEAHLALVGVGADGRELRLVEEIKAVTYHGVEIRERDGQLETLLVLDV